MAGTHPILTTTHVLTSHDLKYIMAMLLSPTKYTLWEWGSKCMLNQLIAEYANDEARVGLTTDHLAREGQHSQPANQAVNIPRQVLDNMKNMAQKALVQDPEGSTPKLDNVKFKQEPGELYMKFTDCLKQVLDKQVQDKRTKDKLLRSLRAANANPARKKVLCAFPPDPEPTFLQKIKACNHLRTTEQVAAVQTQAIMHGVAEALADMQFPFKGPWQHPQGPDRCFHCSQPGHLSRNCPQNGGRYPVPSRNQPLVGQD